MKQSVVPVFVALVGLWPAPGRAQPPAPQAALSLTLEDAIRRGLETSHRVEEMQARFDGVEAVADQRGAATRPQVAAQAGYTRTNHVPIFGILRPPNQFVILYPDVPDNYRARLDAQWLLYDGGRRQSTERAARSDALGASRDIETARLDLRLDITRAYWALVTATEATRVVDESLARMDAQLRVVRNQLEHGHIRAHDRLLDDA